MRIRKRQRKGNVEEEARAEESPCFSILKGGDWSIQKSSEDEDYRGPAGRDNDDDVVIGPGLTVMVQSAEATAVVQKKEDKGEEEEEEEEEVEEEEEGRIEPVRRNISAIEAVRLGLQKWNARHAQPGEDYKIGAAGGGGERDQEEEEQPQKKIKTTSSQQQQQQHQEQALRRRRRRRSSSSSAVAPLSPMSGNSRCQTSRTGFGSEPSSMAKAVDQSRSTMKGNCDARGVRSHGGDVEVEDNEEETTRHYVRRGLRKGCGTGDAQFQVQSTPKQIPPDDDYDDDHHHVQETAAAAAAAGPRGGGGGGGGAPAEFSQQGMKNLHSGEGVTWKCKLSSAEPCYSNDDDKDHPSREVEGSLLHSLYLQLLAVGAEGITLRKLYTSFATQTSVHRHGSSWRDKVREHLKTNPYFVEVKGRYLLCEQLVQSTSKRHIKRNNDIPCGVKSNDLVGEPGNSEGVNTRRKAYQKTIEAVLSESAMEFQKLQRANPDNGHVSTEAVTLTDSRESDFVVTEPIVTKPIPAKVPIRKRRKSSDDEEEGLSRNIRYGGAIPGSLKAMQAKIIAETGLQDGVRCARKDGSNDSSKWQCPMMAIEGNTLCEHHSFLNARKKARYAKAKKQGDGILRIKLSPHGKVRGSKSISRKGVDSDVHCSSMPEAKTSKSDSKDLGGLDEIASQALVTLSSDVIPVDVTQHERCTEGDLTGSEEPDHSIENLNGVSKVEEEQKSMSNSFRAPKGGFIAAKKTAANNLHVAMEKLPKAPSLPLIRPPTIPPLPAFYGMRRKTVKNRSLLTL